jgi:tight adherence protein B
VTGALVTAALALLLWPDRRAARRSRLARGTGRASLLAGWPRDLPVPPAAAALAAGVAGSLSTPLVAALAGVATFLGARAWVAGRSGGRAEEQLQALTEGLAALAADLRSGRSLAAATEAAVAACGNVDCGRELARALRSPEGAPTDGLDAALAEALGRIAAAVRLSERTGCSLAAVATAVEDDLRARRRHRLELRAAVAAPRASALLLAGLPVLGLAMGSGVGADPWGVLTTTGSGQVLLVAGVTLELAGLAWSERLVRRVLP